MKTTLLFFVCLLLINTGQRDKAEKESEKDRLKRPAEVTVRAKLERVRSLMLTDYARDGWQVEKDSASTLVFRRMGTFQTRMAYGSLAQLEDRFTLTESDGAVLIIADLGVVLPAAGGGALDRRDWNRDKRSRQRVETYFARLKEQAEKP